MAFFDKYSRLVGWINETDQMIYDTNIRWVGFAKNNYVFTTTCRWVGGFQNGTLIDKNGKPVAWNNGHNPTGTLPLTPPLTPLRPLIPLTPLRPLTPLKPLRPFTPVGGWSPMDWSDLWKS